MVNKRHFSEILLIKCRDNVEWDEEQKKIAVEKIKEQMLNPVIDKKRYTVNPSFFWNKFYKNHKTNFFKDRKWLLHEFPQIYDCIMPNVNF